MVVTDPSHGEAGEASTSVFLGEKKNSKSVIEIFTGRICVCELFAVESVLLLKYDLWPSNNMFQTILI